jgi:isovaleryl-CoA dehydrogenase
MMSATPSLKSAPATRAKQGLGDGEKTILEQVDRFARNELHPLQRKMDDEEWWPDHIFPLMGEKGYLGVTAPQSLGGAELNFFSSGLVVQALARWNHSVALGILGHENSVLNNIVGSANEDIRRRYVPGLCDGTVVGALAITEPDAGSDAVGSMRTTARRDGDDFVLNGTKLYITNGPIADIILLYARTDADAGPRGVTAFVLETDTPGFNVSQKLVKMGLRGTQTAELVFEDCRVPAANIVGQENGGVAVMMTGLDLERVGLSFLILGMAERAFDLAVEYARSRVQFGKPISDFQLVRGMIADMYTELEALRSFVYDVGGEVSAIDHGAEFHHVKTRSAALVLQAGRSNMNIVDKALQVHGGTGYIWETEINCLYRAGKLWQIGAGTTEVRQDIIGREIFGSPTGR